MQNLTRAQLTDHYLDLMKMCLSGSLYEDMDRTITLPNGTQMKALDARTEGMDRPTNAQSMIGFKRLDNLRFCVEDVLARNVPGDLIETGVWRGGATIFMRAILLAHNISDRI